MRNKLSFIFLDKNGRRTCVCNFGLFSNGGIRESKLFCRENDKILHYKIIYPSNNKKQRVKKEYLIINI